MEGYRIEGGCLCGAVRFEVTERPLSAGYCHCTRCQRRTGTGSGVSVRINPDGFQLLAGEEHVAGWQPPDGMEKCFCRICGAHLLSRNSDWSRISIRMSAFDGDPGVRPSYRQFVADAASWEPIPDDGLVRFAQARPAAMP